MGGGRKNGGRKRVGERFLKFGFALKFDVFGDGEAGIIHSGIDFEFFRFFDEFVHGILDFLQDDVFPDVGPFIVVEVDFAFFVQYGFFFGGQSLGRGDA